MRGVIRLVLVPLVVAAFAAARPADAGDGPLVDEARRKLRAKDVGGAVRALEKAIADDPLDADAHMLYQDFGSKALGAEAILTTYRQKAQKADDPLFAFLHARLLPPDQALGALDKLIQQFPRSPWPHAGRARALEALGRGSEAEAEYDAAINFAGGDIRFQAYRAFGLERAGKFAAAADAWKLVLVQRPKDRAATLGLGEAYRRQGLLEDALSILGPVVQADPTDAEARYRVALVQMDEGKYADAIVSLDQALATEKLFVEALCAATEASVKLGFAEAEKAKRDPVEKDFAKAIQYGTKAAAIAPDSADAHFAKGAAHEAAGEDNAIHYDTALVDYDSALNLIPMPGPEKVRALCAKAFVLLRLARWDQSQAAADKALGIDDKCAPAYSHAGHALAAQGKQDEAIKKYYLPGLKAAPNDARLHDGLGLAKWELGKLVEARKSLEQAVKLDPENSRYRVNLGELYYELKMWKQAGDELFKATELRPNDWVAWNCYGRACCAMKDWSQGAEVFEKVITLLTAPPPAPAGGAGDKGGKPADGADAGDGGLAEGVTDVEPIIAAHLYLAIIYSDHLKKRDKAQEHIKKFLEMGGTDVNLQAWIDGLMADEK